MYKLIFDSDALIKLTKANIIKKVCKELDCLTTKEVENECVIEGKKRFYGDALIIEGLIDQGLIKIKDIKNKVYIKEKFGAGELSLLNLYKEQGKSVIVTDDSAFAKYLINAGIEFIVPVDLIVVLLKKKIVDKKAALSYLNGLKIFIRREVFENIRKEIKEAKK